MKFQTVLGRSLLFDLTLTNICSFDAQEYLDIESKQFSLASKLFDDNIAEAFALPPSSLLSLEDFLCAENVNNTQYVEVTYYYEHILIIILKLFRWWS